VRDLGKEEIRIGYPQSPSLQSLETTEIAFDCRALIFLVAVNSFAFHAFHAFPSSFRAAFIIDNSWRSAHLPPLTRFFSSALGFSAKTTSLYTFIEA